MELLILLPIGFVGSVLWVVSAEASAIYYGTEGYHPLAVGTLAALGQCLAYMCLYFGGAKLVGRWVWLAGQVERLQTRYHERLQSGYLSAVAVGSVLGVPPCVGLVTLAPAFHVKFIPMWPIAFGGRIIRFTILAAVGTEIVAWWNDLAAGCS